MNKGKVLGVIIAIVLGILLGIFFLRMFKFESNSIVNEISEDTVNKLYSYLPNQDILNKTIYGGGYVSSSDLSNEVEGIITYSYIKYEDSNLIQDNKIKGEDFLRVVKLIFGSSKDYEFKNFVVNDNTYLEFKDDYYTINKKSEKEMDYIIKKDKINYIVLDNGKKIKIYEYYLLCDKKTSLCYDDEQMTEKNSYVNYKSINELDKYKDKLKKYEQTFMLEDDGFIWESNQGL